MNSYTRHKNIISQNTSLRRNKINQQGGLVKAAVVIVIALLIISYYGLNLREIVSKPVTQSNFAYVWEQVTKLWSKGKEIIVPIIGQTLEKSQGTTTPVL